MKNIIKYKILIFSLLILVGAVSWYVSSGKNMKSQSSVNGMNQQTIKFIAPINLQDVIFMNDFAQDKGFYAKNNLIVENISAEKDFTSLLLSGSGDVVIGSYTGSMAAYLNNAQVRGLGTLSRQFRTFGVSRFPRNQVQMIKKVAVESLSGDPLVVLKTALKNIGVDPASVEVVAIASVEAREAMLANGELDFIILSKEQQIDKLDQAKNFTIYQTEELTKGSNDFLQIYTLQNKIINKSVALKSFIKSQYQALQFADNNPEEVKEFLRKKYGFSAEMSETFYRRYMNARKDVSLVPSTELMNTIAEKVKINSNITSDKEPAGFLYTDFAKEVVGVK